MVMMILVEILRGQRAARMTARWSCCIVTIRSIYRATNIWNIPDIAQHVRQDVVQLLVLLLFI